MSDEQTKQRLTVLTWALGLTIGLLVALLGTTINMSFQLGRSNGALDVLIQHVQLK